MDKFLDKTGLTHLWSKIKAKFATITYVDEEIEGAAFVGQDDGSGGIIDSDNNTVTIYSGSLAPSSSTGSNGDIYIQTS